MSSRVNKKGKAKIAPMRSLEPSEQAFRLKQRALAIEYAEDRRTLNHWLDHFPELTPEALNHVKQRANGRQPPPLPSKAKGNPAEDVTRGSAFTERDDDSESENLDEAATMASKRQRTSHARSVAGSIVPASSAAALASPKSDSSDDPFRIPRCSTRFRMITPETFLLIFSSVESISLSKYAVKPLCAKGAKVPAKPKLLEINEFLTGMCEEDHLPPALHDVVLYIRLTKERQEKMNRLAREMALPPDWRRDGIYSITCEGDNMSYFLTHRGLNKKEAIPNAVMAAFEKPETIYVDKNFSERRAELCDSSGFTRQLIHLTFPSFAKAFIPLATRFQSSLITTPPTFSPPDEPAPDGSIAALAPPEGSVAS